MSDLDFFISRLREKYDVARQECDQVDEELKRLKELQQAHVAVCNKLALALASLKELRDMLQPKENQQ